MRICYLMLVLITEFVYKCNRININCRGVINFKMFQLTKLIQLVPYIPVLGMMLVFASLPFGFTKFQRISLFIFGIGYLLDLLLFKRFKGWKWSQDKWPFLLCILFYLLIPIWHLFETGMSSQYYLHCIESRMPFILYGIIGIIGLNDKFRIRDFAIVLAVTSVIVLVYSIVKYYQLLGSNWVWEGHSLYESLMVYVYSTSKSINAHMTFNMFMNIVLLLALFMFRAEGVQKWKRILMIISMVCVVIGITMSFGRTGALSMIFIIVSFVFYFLWTRMSKWNRCFLIFLASLPILVITFYPQFSNKSVTNDPRRVIWNVCAEMIKDKPVLGYGVVGAREQLVERGLNDPKFYHEYYESIYMLEPILDREGNVDKMQMHPHNIFLSTMMEFGVLGVVILLGCLLAPIFFIRCRYKFFLTLFVIIFSFQGVFESFGPHLLPTFFMFELLLWNYASDRDSFSLTRRSIEDKVPLVEA